MFATSVAAPVGMRGAKVMPGEESIKMELALACRHAHEAIGDSAQKHALWALCILAFRVP